MSYAIATENSIVEIRRNIIPRETKAYLLNISCTSPKASNFDNNIASLLKRKISKHITMTQKEYRYLVTFETQSNKVTSANILLTFRSEVIRQFFHVIRMKIRKILYIYQWFNFDQTNVLSSGEKVNRKS